METSVASQITNQSKDRLAEIARNITGQDVKVIDEISATQIGRSAGTATAGIFRVTGRVRIDYNEHAWSAVVKALGESEFYREGVEADPFREVEVYRSELFADICGGVRAARCFAIQRLQDLELLWLEDLSEAPQPPWSSEQLIESARHFGQFNAYWPDDRLPQVTWLQYQSMQDAFIRRPAFQRAFELLPERRQEPLIREFAPTNEVDKVLRLWHNCHELLRKGDEMPKGVSHLDCHPKNLFPMYDDNGLSYTVGVDWTMAGIASLGIDVGHMLSSPLTWLEISPNEAQALCEPMFDAYIAGLRNSGWADNVDHVRIVYLTRLACEAIRNTYLISYASENEKWYAGMEEAIGRPMDDIVAHYRACRPFFVSCMEEAQQLANEVP